MLSGPVKQNQRRHDNKGLAATTINGDIGRGAAQSGIEGRRWDETNYPCFPSAHFNDTR